VKSKFLTRKRRFRLVVNFPIVPGNREFSRLACLCQLNRGILEPSLFAPRPIRTLEWKFQ